MQSVRLLFGTTIVLSVTFFSAKSNAENLVQKADVRVTNGGKAIVYYKQGNDIVIVNCGGNYPRVESRSSCTGRENRVPIEVFKQILQAEFLVGDPRQFKPLTTEELDTYRGADLRDYSFSIQAKELNEDLLERIEKFIKDGAGAQAQIDKQRTEAQLQKIKEHLAKIREDAKAVVKVNALIKDIIDKIVDDKTFHKVADGRDGNTALFNLLQQFDASNGQCGTDAILNGSKDYDPGIDELAPGGRRATQLWDYVVSEAKAEDIISVERRIQNCAALPNSTKKTASGVVWNLVARSRDPKTGKFTEVWRDSKSGIIWGDELESYYKHTDAISLGSNCKKISEYSSKCNVIQETACNSAAGSKSMVGMKGRKYGLPTIEEFDEAEKHNIRDVIPNMRHGFWYLSASRNSKKPDTVRVFNALNGRTDFVVNHDNPSDTFAVRCIIR